jgi:energy-coupling factor transporter ATP-binding protein EcfA2
LDALLSALSAAVLEREGGVVLHAAAIEWRKRAVLFVGPSGAGKTTAGNHCAGALSFARDRVALVGSGAGFAAWPLPGGSSDGALLPSSNRSWLPLAGIVRVRRGRTMPHFERLAAAHALAVLRESALSSSGAAVEEGQLLASLADIVSATPVDALHTVLGEPLAEVIDEWLGEEAP